MKAMVTMGHGGLDQLVFHRDWPKPEPAAGDVLIKVKACGLNNTDINTRSGWYSKTVTDATTDDVDPDQLGNDPSWGGKAIEFPRIQGADACGIIEAVGPGVDPARVGERVITDNWLRDPADPDNLQKVGYFGSERDGGFAEYTTIPGQNALAVNSSFSDAELATFSCSYATAEGMLSRANVNERDTVLIPGASGGVGGALVQLAKQRGARVIAMASESKHAELAALGPDVILPRAPKHLSKALAGEQVTVIADVVGGDDWPARLECLARGGRYTCSGAIAGPLVSFDLRTFYLRDLTFTGSTVTAPSVIKRVITAIESGKLQPVLAATYPLEDLARAQTEFLNKTHAGNIVVVPD